MVKILKPDEKNLLSSLADTPVAIITVGAMWDGKKKGLLGHILNKPEAVDLDFSCVLYDNEGQTHDTVWYANLMSRCGAVRHHGDDTTGEEDGLDEQITIDLEKLPPEVETMFFVISSFSGQTFNDVEHCSVILGQTAGLPMVKFNVPGRYDRTSKIMIRVKREPEGWTVKGIGKGADGTKIQDIYSNLRAELHA